MMTDKRNIIRKVFITVNILLGLFGLLSCAQSSDRVVYKYSEAEVYFDGFEIKKAVYTPGEMKLYYSGGDLEDNRIKCYNAELEDLGDEFEHTFKNGVLTVKADFAEKISGIMIDDAKNGIIYHLRYLDSSQFAWLADVLWLDDGWRETGDAEKYYTAAELQAQADEAEAKRQETLKTFALLEGVWISDDGTQRCEFTLSENGDCIIAEGMWLDEEQVWQDWFFSAEAAYQSEQYNDDDEKTEILEITLVNGDHSEADMHILYNQREQTLQEGDTIYHKE